MPHNQHAPRGHHTSNGGKHHHDLVEVKSKFDAEFRRFCLDRTKMTTFEAFHTLLESFHRLQGIPFLIFYTDPIHGDLLPINNDENYAKAVSSSKPLLRLHLQRKGEGWEQMPFNRGKKNFFGLLPSGSPHKNKLSIGLPEDFRQVSQIIDVDILPETCRRVRLVKHGSDKPLGFYIRDGNSVRVTPKGLERGHGIFISRLVPGGLAEGTGLLAVNDEVLEVNGIDVAGKTLDQVTDMMVANSSNLIITIRPATQRSLPLPVSSLTSSGFTNSAFRSSQGSGSRGSRHSSNSDDEEDEVRDHLLNINNNPNGKQGDNNTTTNNKRMTTEITINSTNNKTSSNNSKKANGNNGTIDEDDTVSSTFEDVVTL